MRPRVMCSGTPTRYISATWPAMLRFVERDRLSLSSWIIKPGYLIRHDPPRENHRVDRVHVLLRPTIPSRVNEVGLAQICTAE